MFPPNNTRDNAASSLSCGCCHRSRYTFWHTSQASRSPPTGQRADHTLVDVPELVLGLQVDHRRHGQRLPGPSMTPYAEQR